MAAGKKTGIRLFIWRKSPGSWRPVPSLNQSHRSLKHTFLLYLHQFCCCLCFPQSSQQQKKKKKRLWNRSFTRSTVRHTTCKGILYTYLHADTRTHADIQVVSLFLDDADSVSGKGNFDYDASTERHCYLTLYAFRGKTLLHWWTTGHRRLHIFRAGGIYSWWKRKINKKKKKRKNRRYWKCHPLH